MIGTEDKELCDILRAKVNGNLCLVMVLNTALINFVSSTDDLILKNDLMPRHFQSSLTDPEPLRGLVVDSRRCFMRNLRYARY